MTGLVDRAPTAKLDSHPGNTWYIGTGEANTAMPVWMNSSASKLPMRAMLSLCDKHEILNFDTATGRATAVLAHANKMATTDGSAEHINSTREIPPIPLQLGATLRLSRRQPKEPDLTPGNRSYSLIPIGQFSQVHGDLHVSDSDQ